MSAVGARFNNGWAGAITRAEEVMLLLLIILIVLLFGAVPAWPYSRNWGYYPSGGLGLVVLILVIMLLAGRI